MSAQPRQSFPIAPLADLIGGLLLIVLGAAVAVASWRMDRLEQQGATLYTAPGLWPGLIGALVVLLGAILTLRSLQRARTSDWSAGTPNDTELVPGARFALAVVLFFVYALVLVGHGLPFWAGTALFVGVFVFLFRRHSAEREGGLARDAIVAAATGGITALVVTLVFEQLFYVRLP
jgi:hypothetical protein